MMFDDFLRMIKEGTPFAFSRWGDGEWACLLNRDESAANCDQHKYFVDLSDELARVLFSKPTYLLGMQGLATRTMGERIYAFLELNHLDFNWANADVFCHASIKGDFDPFLEACKNRNTVLIGPDYLRPLAIYQHFIEVPRVNCWLERNEIMRELKNYLKRSPNSVVLFCASMASNVLIDDIFNWDNHHTYIDAGSVLDPYVQMRKRGYHEDVIRRLVDENKIFKAAEKEETAE